MNGQDRQRGFSQMAANPWLMLFMAMLAGGGTAVGYRHSAFSDPYPGHRGEAMEVQVAEISRQLEHVITEHDHFASRLEELPPQHLLADVAELKAEIRLLSKSNVEMLAQLQAIRAMIKGSGPQYGWCVQGFNCPNDLQQGRNAPRKSK